MEGCRLNLQPALLSYYWNINPGDLEGRMTSCVCQRRPVCFAVDSAVMANRTISVINGLADPIKHPTVLLPAQYFPLLLSLSLLLSVPAGWCVFLDRQSLCVEVCVCLSV